jgi:hypothetical protein
MPQEMTNVEFKRNGNTLTITVDLSQDYGLSSTGKSFTVGTTHGFISVGDGISFSLNVNSTKPIATQKKVSVSRELERVPVAKNMLVIEKAVNWSTLNHGMVIPETHLDGFFEAIGGAVASGLSREITIDIQDDNYPASVIYAEGDAVNSVQIRYSPSSQLAYKLKAIFANTHSYCVSERNRNGNNSRIKIPNSIKERIHVLATGIPGTLRFDCKPYIANSDFPLDRADGVHANHKYNVNMVATAPRTQEEEAVGSLAPKALPTKISLFDKEHLVKTWSDVLVKVCEALILYCPYDMADMDNNADFSNNINTKFSYIQSDMRYEGKRLTNGLWVETEHNGEKTLGICHKLLDKCGFSSKALYVEIMEATQ